MKKLIILAIATLGLSFANAQTPAEKQVAADFVTSRADTYVKNVKPVFVNNEAELAKIENGLDKQKVSYRKYSFIFIGEVNDANCVGGEMNSYTQDNRKPVLYYTMIKEQGRNVILVISGHNGF
jgi:hypothetical protein